MLKSVEESQHLEEMIAPNPPNETELWRSAQQAEEQLNFRDKPGNPATRDQQGSHAGMEPEERLVLEDRQTREITPGESQDSRNCVYWKVVQ